MSLREQFEAHYRGLFLDVTDHDFRRDKSKPENYEDTKVWDHWDTYQAGHAASGREELLKALEAILAAVETMRCPQNIDDAAMLVIRFSAVIDQSRAAIKKARGEQ